MGRKAAPYGGMQNGSYGKKKAEKVKPEIRWKTEGDKLSRRV